MHKIMPEVQSTYYCLVISESCSTEKIYVYIGTDSYDANFDTEFATGSKFISIDELGFSGFYWTRGICPPDPLETCPECLASTVGALPFASVTIYDDNDGSNNNCYQNSCILLENCENRLDRLVVDNSFAVYMDTVIKLEGSTKCWHVKEYTACDNLTEGWVVTGSCDTCLDCLPLPEPVYPKVEPVYYEDYTQITEQQNQIDTNVKFANSYWDLVKATRFGVDSACDTIDRDKITIKKMICDFSNMYDPNNCVVPIIDPVPEPCPEPDQSTPAPEPI
jgi:hypothetical protein